MTMQYHRITSHARVYMCSSMRVTVWLCSILDTYTKLANTWAKFQAVTTRNFLEIDALATVRGVAAVNFRIRECPYKLALCIC
jgi:hypothetical protein